MAGDWIKIEHALPDKPEVMEMATILGIDPDAVVGKLIRVWTWFDNHTEDGNANVTVRALLDRHAGVSNFILTMQGVGWIQELEGMLRVSHFDRHNGQSAKQRTSTNRRVAKSRNCNGASVTNVTPVALQKPLPEKRREEKSIEEGNAAIADSSPPSDSSPKPKGRASSLDEVKAYAEKHGISKIEAEDFWDRMNAGGWKRGKEMVKDWQSHFRTFHRNGWLASSPSKQQPAGKTGILF